jgi:hypothetical protein
MHALPNGRDDGERLSAEDMAARTAEQMQAGALLAHQLRAAGGAYIQRGMCCNCGARCLPAAVYCDAECKSDHEVRTLAQARQGPRARA